MYNTNNNNDDRAWIREDTLTMLLTIVRLMHLQKSQTYMKCYKGSWCNWMTKDG